MSCKISKKLTENGENDEKTIFSPFFPTKLNFYKKLLMKIAFYLMQKNATFACDLCIQRPRQRPPPISSKKAKLLRVAIISRTRCPIFAIIFSVVTNGLPQPNFAYAFLSMSRRGCNLQNVKIPSGSIFMTC